MFGDFIRQGGTIEHEQRALRPQALAMASPSQHLLARAGFTLDQQGQILGRQSASLMQQGLHHAAVGHKQLEATLIP